MRGKSQEVRTAVQGTQQQIMVSTWFHVFSGRTDIALKPKLRDDFSVSFSYQSDRAKRESTLSVVGKMKLPRAKFVLTFIRCYLWAGRITATSIKSRAEPSHNLQQHPAPSPHLSEILVARNTLGNNPATPTSDGQTQFESYIPIIFWGKKNIHKRETPENMMWPASLTAV